MCFSLACCGWMLLWSIFAFINVMHSTVHPTTTLYYHQGDSSNISCNYLSSNNADIITVRLQKNTNVLCSYMRVKSWINQSCADHIRFIWIPETNKILFELSNLQINDTGAYSCTVKRLTPPPEVILWEEITIVNVIVSPVLFMSCVETSNGSLMIVCSSEGFYPAALHQLWMRDGEIIINSNNNEIYSTNTDGSFTHKSYLELPSQMFNETIFTCWINHSSLNEPIMANLSSTVCYETSDLALTMNVWFVVSAVLVVFVVITVIAVTCKCYRRAKPRSAVDVGVTPEPVFQDNMQSFVLYSSLGDHHPVPCSRSPSGVSSPLNAD
ncbi:uncharacterized protein [Misgurnus anguillicaudatus]|uniref:uncharacterized protein n=1 Tax=Misgurnus anguillicaudatus TaxID=75329 RepID=UPI003CCF1B46